MSYDTNAIKDELKKHIPQDYTVDLDEVIGTVEIIDGLTVFTMLSDGYAFVGNQLVDVMPGWKKSNEMVR